jgi:hypothetical protein
MIDPVEAVAQIPEAEEWKEPPPQLPMDHAGLVTTALPLLSIAFFFGIMLVRSVP